MRPVRIGRVQDGWTQIESGLTPGEHVVVDGQYKLQNGSKVRTGAPKGAGGSDSGRPAGARTNGAPTAPRS